MSDPIPDLRLKHQGSTTLDEDAFKALVSKAIETECPCWMDDEVMGRFGQSLTEALLPALREIVSAAYSEGNGDGYSEGLEAADYR